MVFPRTGAQSSAQQRGDIVRKVIGSWKGRGFARFSPPRDFLASFCHARRCAVVPCAAAWEQFGTPFLHYALLTAHDTPQKSLGVHSRAKTRSLSSRMLNDRPARFGFKQMKVILLRWVIPASMVMAVFGLCLNPVGNSANPDDPEAQLAAMVPVEREYCEGVLSKIIATSTKKDVEALLGKPSSSRRTGGSSSTASRIVSASVSAGMAWGIPCVLDGVQGRFYYFLTLEKKQAGD